MPVPVRRPGVQRYEEILDAALRCFVERGLADTGIEDIRREAGASPSSMYHLFDGLTDITVTLLERTFERLFEYLTAQVAPAPSGRDAVTALVRGHVSWVLRHRDEAGFMYQATAVELAPGAADRVLARKLELLEPLMEQVAPFLAAGELPDWPVEQLDIVVLGPAHEACRRLLAGAPVPEEWMLTELPEAAWRSLAASKQ